MSAETKEQYEGAILNQLIKNSERLAVIGPAVQNNSSKLSSIDERLSSVEKQVKVIYDSIKWLVGLLGAILIAVLANLISSPIANLFG